MRLVRRLHEEILETSDVKILESAIQNQSALTAKSVVETLRGDLNFSRSSTDVIAGINSKHVGKDVEDRIVGHFAEFVKELEKISGISAEILNSVEDLKQLNRYWEKAVNRKNVVILTSQYEPQSYTA